MDLSDTEQLEYVSKPKSAICQEIGVDVLIDDNLDHAMDCAATLGIDVLLYDRKGQYKWNHSNNKSSSTTTTTTTTTASASNATTSSKNPKKANCHTLTSMSRQLYHNHQHHHHAPMPSNVTRVSSWKEIIAFFPKPHSPLRNCYYPQDLVYQEDEDDDEQEDEYDGIEYETVEVDMDLTDDDDDEDDDDYNHYRSHNKIQKKQDHHSFNSVSISDHEDDIDQGEEEMVWL